MATLTDLLPVCEVCDVSQATDDTVMYRDRAGVTCETCADAEPTTLDRYVAEVEKALDGIERACSKAAMHLAQCRVQWAAQALVNAHDRGDLA